MNSITDDTLRNICEAILDNWNRLHMDCAHTASMLYHMEHPSTQATEAQIAGMLKAAESIGITPDMITFKYVPQGQA